MFAVVQFPLTDIRPFLDVATYRIAAPAWPILHIPDEPYRAPFVRGFGRARARLQGGVDEWPGEGAYCDVSHALRFVTTVLKDTPTVARRIPKRYCAFRRMFWDGQLEAGGSVVGRIELGFGLRLDGEEPLSGIELGDAIEALLKQKVRVSPSRDATTKPVVLSNAGGQLASAYLSASTARVPEQDASGDQWWLQGGGPLIIVEYVRDTEIESLPRHTMPVNLKGESIPGLRVFLGRRQLEGRERPIWFFECDPQSYDRDALRRLRINVTRLHSVITSLRILSDLQLKNRLAPATEDAKKNLRNCLSRFLPFLYRNEHLGFESSEFLRAALSLQETLTPAEFTTLRSLHPAPGRGLRAQFDSASTVIDAHQPAPPPPIQWDVFIAHAGSDVAAAEILYELLQGKLRVFLDVRCLEKGGDWDLDLPKAQIRSYMTVVLVGNTTDQAYYLRSEIEQAISLSRLDEERHRVVPVYLDAASGRSVVKPYGLNLKHGIELAGPADMPKAATQIIDAIAQAQRSAAPT
jgi:hypothetical protein